MVVSCKLEGVEGHAGLLLFFSEVGLAARDSEDSGQESKRIRGDGERARPRASNTDSSEKEVIYPGLDWGVGLLLVATAPQV